MGLYYLEKKPKPQTRSVLKVCSLSNHMNLLVYQNGGNN